MPERYDRSVCANALTLRNTAIQKVVGGLAIAPAFYLPETGPGGYRIGKALGDSDGAHVEHEPSPATHPVLTDADPSEGPPLTAYRCSRQSGVPPILQASHIGTAPVDPTDHEADAP